MHEVFLLFLLIFTPLAHGAVEVWSITVVHVVSIAMSAWWLLSMTSTAHFRIIRTPIDIPVLIFLALACLSVFTSTYPYASRIQLYKIIEGRLLGFRIFSPGQFYTSLTFVNHNHFAGYMEMITMICIGLV
jgi:hypothetical protein